MADERKSLWRKVTHYLFQRGQEKMPTPETTATPVEAKPQSYRHTPLLKKEPPEQPKPAPKQKADPYPSSPLADHATQYPGTLRTQASTITIGFDWGTSCTKVILRDPYGLNTPSYLVDFGAMGQPGQTYLLPSRLYINDQGEGSLHDKGNDKAVGDIKLRLLQPDPGPLPIGPRGRLRARRHEIAALYVAATLRFIRTWFLGEQADTYKSFQIDWQFNLGIPVPSYDDTALCGLFQEIARVGWWLSIQEGALTIGQAREGFERTQEDDFDPGLDAYAINVVPEVAAQVVGYAKSSLRTPGLHLLVDIGAATLDVAGFILYEREGEDQYSFLSAEIRPIGAYKLHAERVDTAVRTAPWNQPVSSEINDWCAQLVRGCDPLSAVPQRMKDYYPPSVRKHVKAPVEPDHTYSRGCELAIQAILEDLRINRDPRSPAWRDGLPFFLSGGGQFVEPYVKAVRSIRFHWPESRKVAPFRIKALPKPQNLKARGLKEADYHRISVAYGLGFPIDDIGRVKPPSAIRDFRIVSTKESEFTYEDTKDWT